jgi:uncharacterized protein with FMN-binding domain
MKKLLSILLVSVLALAFSPDVPVVTEKDGLVLINTTTLCAQYEGYNGPTPVLITLKEGKVAQVQTLPNQETPAYFELLKEEKLFERWNGLSASDAAELEVDIVSGATYSSDAIIHNVRSGLIFYLKSTKNQP